ncbi:MAG: DUF2721 domain-containing protein [Candidatus Cloacimonadota bacterium]|nr:MAG: DUF2721 domain-containing protein [Candidatus Cloacimonadota bacterium]
MDNIQNLIQVMQSAISPIVLISGVGLLLLSFTNRLGRVIDRARFLVKEVENGNQNEIIPIQIGILYKRGRILRTAITSIVITILVASLLILLIFLGYITNWNMKLFFISFFIIAIISLIIAVMLFLTDVTLALKALKLQVKGFIKK